MRTLPGPPPTTSTLKDLNSAVTTGRGEPSCHPPCPWGRSPWFSPGHCDRAMWQWSLQREVCVLRRERPGAALCPHGVGGRRGVGPQAGLPAARAMMSWNLLKPPEPRDIPPPTLLSSFPTAGTLHRPPPACSPLWGLCSPSLPEAGELGGGYKGLPGIQDCGIFLIYSNVATIQYDIYVIKYNSVSDKIF